MKHSISKAGIIDLIRNPFAINSWIDQGYGLTPRRSDQLSKLLYKSVDDISALPENEGKYVAFISIRWGFAVIEDGKLLPTKKWDNRQTLGEYGQPI
jgi:hypothetical protein